MNDETEVVMRSRALVFDAIHSLMRSASDAAENWPSEKCSVRFTLTEYY